MGRTLSFLDHLLSKARRLLEQGQPREALAALRRLTSLTDLPMATAAEIHHLLGTAHLRQGQFKLARRHLRRALLCQPDAAAAHHELARAIETDPQADAARAARFHDRAVEFGHDKPRILADAGAYFVQMGRTKKGLALLVRAVELAPDDVDFLRMLVEGLCEARRFNEARRAIGVARFRFRGQPLLDQLKDEVEFGRVSHEQQSARASHSDSAGEAMVLPFLNVVSDRSESVRTKKYRRDAGSRARPHLPRIIRRIDSGRSG